MGVFITEDPENALEFAITAAILEACKNRSDRLSRAFKMAPAIANSEFSGGFSMIKTPTNHLQAG